MATYQIRDWVDRLHMQRCTQDFAAALGFPKRACQELAIVASELTSNVLKYGIRGSLELSAVSEQRGEGIRLTARDFGPAFRDLSAAMQDGYDDLGPIDPLSLLKRNGFGGGLGAIVRLTHRFELEPLPEGKRVHVVRYLRESLPLSPVR